MRGSRKEKRWEGESGEGRKEKRRGRGWQVHTPRSTHRRTKVQTSQEMLLVATELLLATQGILVAMRFWAKFGLEKYTLASASPLTQGMHHHSSPLLSTAHYLHPR